jgi:hypothetical protein
MAKIILPETTAAKQENPVDETLSPVDAEKQGENELTVAEEVDNEPITWIDAKGKVDAQQLYLHIIDKYNVVNTEQGLFIHRNGKYDRMSDTDWTAFVKSFIPVEIRNRSQWSAVLTELRTDTTRSMNDFDLPEIINFKNGVLLMEHGTLNLR